MGIEMRSRRPRGKEEVQVEKETKRRKGSY